MSNGFDNIDSSFKNSPMIMERVSLVSSHMYKQFLDYQHATMNTNDIFYQMLDNLQVTVDALKQSFLSRGVSTQNNITLSVNSAKNVVVVNIFWHTFSFTTKCNYHPQALFRENNPALYTGRIMAVKGNYNEIVAGTKTIDEEMEKLLENEIASLYVPFDKNQNTIFKIKHRANREFYLTQIDASRDFTLAVVEAVCSTTVYHEEGSRKTFNI